MVRRARQTRSLDIVLSDAPESPSTHRGDLHTGHEQSQCPGDDEVQIGAGHRQSRTLLLRDDPESEPAANALYVPVRLLIAVGVWEV